MPSFEREVRQILTANGCTFVRHANGDHEIWQSRISGKRFVVDGKITSTHTANEVLKQAGLQKQF